MNIPARRSVKMLARWAMGSMYFCEHYDNPESVPSDAVVKWADNGATLCLRPQDPNLTSEPDGWAEPGHMMSTTFRAMWRITDETLVKVNSWREGDQTEGRTIKFINDNHPEIPTTQLIYEWIDPAWTRSFMIMKYARGVLLNDAMNDMTDSQIQDVAEQVAVHVKTLTQHTSNRLETVDRCGIPETRLVGWRPRGELVHAPSCYQRNWPRFNSEEFKAHLREQSEMTSIPDSGPEFVLYNSDLSPHNIFVYPPSPHQKGQLAEIIDWGITAYWPRYWVATCPHPEAPFVGETGTKIDVRWALYLREALVKAGFESIEEWWVTYDDVSYKLGRERAGKEYEDYVAACRLSN